VVSAESSGRDARSTGQRPAGWHGRDLGSIMRTAASYWRLDAAIYSNTDAGGTPHYSTIYCCPCSKHGCLQVEQRTRSWTRTTTVNHHHHHHYRGMALLVIRRKEAWQGAWHGGESRCIYGMHQVPQCCSLDAVVDCHGSLHQTRLYFLSSMHLI